MSLTVSLEIKSKAKAGTLTADEFYQAVKSSLPFAVDTIHTLAHQADQNPHDWAEFAPDTLPPEKRGELLRAMASDAIRASLCQQFGSHQSRATGIILGFQNCHRVAVFLNTKKGRSAQREWTSQKAQILAQSPELVDC